MSKKKTRKKSPKPPKNKPVGPVLADVTALNAAMASDDAPQLVDVRSAMEFAGGHVKGSINIPLQSLEARLDEIGDRVWVICRSGNRSATAARKLASRGRAVTDVSGGTIAWSAKGYPLEGGSPWMRLAMPLIASLTLGMAPFFPEPHLLGKIRWLAGGGVGMGPADYFDIAMHGAPWVWLLLTVVSVLRKR